ncbi:hypothetical protein SAY87_003115 [Trapa incisa]|uniref:Uncharacterized protein n=1 Tax=Trapa incisa TaxID=236973 RepID=A0AAN7QHL7_9MYRT|nr:hypothetical protein SAY87_003115 [Trapa incisa]
MGLNRSCILLIVIAGMERFAFKGVASNLVTYLTDVMEMGNSSAAKMVNCWCGFTSMLPLLIAPLADSYWDRYSTVLASSFFYVLGLVALTLTAMASAWSSGNTPTSSFLFFSLCLISVGLGGCNPSLQAFATDQIEADDEELPRKKDDQGQPDKKSLFFQWWYFGICTGSLLGTTILSYVQDTFGWVIGFAIPTGAMAIFTVFFCCGNRIYTHKQDLDMYRRPFGWIVKTVKAAASKFMSNDIRLTDEISASGVLELQEKPLCHHLEEKSLMNGQKQQVLQNARVVLRLLPVWITLLMFAVIFQQPATFFTKQGMVMKRTVFAGGSFKIPPATLQSVITLSIILLMPLYDKMLLPAARLFIRNEKGVNVMQRMGIGMFLSVIAMVIAANIETKRLEMDWQVSREDDDEDTAPYEASSLSIFWLLPQYILLGVSDVFTVVGMQEFFYSEVPVRMRTMGFALYTSVFGVGSFLSAVMISIIESFTRGHSWFSDDMNKARLDRFYWLLTVVSALNLLVYMALCKFYKIPSSSIEEDSPT